MGKPKGPRSSGEVQNRALYSRVSYLFQAASYLAAQRPDSESKTPEDEVKYQDGGEGTRRGQDPAAQKIARRLVRDLRSVSLKTRIRLSPALKHTICKFCDTLLVEGETCVTTVENLSKGGMKPWADTIVKKCKACGQAKRFPVEVARQKRSVLRRKEAAEAADHRLEVEDLLSEHDTGTTPMSKQPAPTDTP